MPKLCDLCGVRPRRERTGTKGRHPIHCQECGSGKSPEARAAHNARLLMLRMAHRAGLLKRGRVGRCQTEGCKARWTDNPHAKPRLYCADCLQRRKKAWDYAWREANPDESRAYNSAYVKRRRAEARAAARENAAQAAAQAAGIALTEALE